MVKGITRQVIWIKGTKEKLFEQAIFLVREDALSKGGVTNEQLLKEAREICTHTQSGRHLDHLLWAGYGAGTTGLLWLLAVLLF